MKALVVDDDLVLSDVIAFTLRREGYEVIAAHDGLQALQMWREQTPAIIILDWELPHLNGLEVCRQIRLEGTTPIIMLTVRDSDEDVIRALESGADDYMTKPFSPAQLVARVQAVLRRYVHQPIPKGLSTPGLRLIKDKKLLEHKGQQIHLTRLEYRLLELLILHHGQVLTVNTLMDRVWGSTQGDNAMLKQLIYRLRRKIEPDAANPTYIQAVPGIGYTLVDPETSER